MSVPVVPGRSSTPSPPPRVVESQSEPQYHVLQKEDHSPLSGVVIDESQGSVCPEDRGSGRTVGI